MKTDFVYGFHGTSETAANDIVRRNRWKVSKNKHDWLGEGIYFFQDSPIRALLFAEKRCDKLRKKTGRAVRPAVVRAKIDLTHCADLTDADWMLLLRIAHLNLQAKAARSGGKLPDQTPLVPKIVPRASYKIERGRHVGPVKGPLPATLLHCLDRVVCDQLIEDLSPSLQLTSIRAAFLDGHPAFQNSWLFDVSHVQLSVFEPTLCILGNPEKIDIAEIRRRRDDANHRCARYSP